MVGPRRTGPGPETSRGKEKSDLTISRFDFVGASAAGPKGGVADADGA
jgi:hypothetical protein